MSTTRAAWRWTCRGSVSPDPEFPPPVICVIDSSVLINLKQVVGIDEQWDLLSEMLTLVASGALAFPRQVVKELSAVRYPDAPGAWIGSARRRVRHPEPSEDSLVRVLEVAAELVEVDSPPEREVADPYVAAMALELVERHPQCRVVLVTNDVVDRLPNKIALRTACARLGLPTCQISPFMDWLHNLDEASLEDPMEDTSESAS